MSSDTTDFDVWLETVEQKYKSLSSSQCDQTLDRLISISQGSQLYHLSQLLDGLLKRDFISLLPHEISFLILQGLDADTLLTCCKVSEAWADVVNSCGDAWYRVCAEAGLSVTESSHDATHWKNKYLRCSRRLRALEHGDCFTTKMLFGHNDRVMALYYQDGLLATGSDDHTVRIWECSTGRCLKIIQTHSVAEIKFNKDHIFTASFDTTAVCWSFHTGELQHRYSGHVAAVFSIDFSTSLDLVITGSADSTVKIWNLSQGYLMQTMPQHRSNWIMQVRLIECENSYKILSRDNVSIHMWCVDPHNHQILTMEEWQKPHNDLVPGLQVRDNTVHYAGVDSDNVCYVIQNDLNDPERKHKQRVSHHIHRDSFMQAFLGSGAHYDVVLSQCDIATVDIVRHSDRNVFTSIRLPSDYRQSKRMSTFSLGERGWLDGLDGDNDCGLFFVTSLRDNSIMLLMWSPIREDENFTENFT